MKGRGGIALAPQRRLRWILGIHLLWLGIIVLLGAWWARLMIRQSATISDLESRLGITSEAIGTSLERTQRMLLWEAAFFFGMLVLATGAQLWLYFREEKRVRGLQAFFASVTHELRTPLTSIRLQAESLAEEDPDPSVIRRLLEDTQRLESQVERTLELARVEGGGKLFTQPIRLKPWIDRALSAWSESHGDRLELQSELGDAAVEADSSAIQVIVRNLLENSLRHAGLERVRATLHARREDQGGRITLIYRDSGNAHSGSAESLGRLFQRGDRSQGAGVGLYLIRALMVRMGGEARFQGGPGFEVQLVFREAEAVDG